MKKIILATMFVIVFLSLTACGGQPSTPIVSPPDIPADQKYVVTDPSVPIEVAVGGEFYIAVESNPTTGYHWEVMNSWNPNLMVMVANEYQSTSPEGVVGGGGMDIWRFDALSAGDATFTISYFPPGDATDPQQTLTFTVNIR
ncbi:MAG: protease inhibitor I42 family protein [Chloroflexi bacterium]|nr:protease inhibitor I42 family protein [Chloroflexota bacterium]